jgi:putative flippase GtrA
VLRHWIRFNAVGIIGFAVQLLVLTGLLLLGLHYLPATVIAVEAAILQNFLWHERWTWRDRQFGGTCRVERLWRFHLLNGVVSVLGNLALMRLLVGELGMAALPANLLAVLVCSTVNFAAGNALVWVTVAPRTSHLAPRTSHLAPRTSAPRTSPLGPRTSRLGT